MIFNSSYRYFLRYSIGVVSKADYSGVRNLGREESIVFQPAYAGLVRPAVKKLAIQPMNGDDAVSLKIRTSF
jgi:hypothetical protein